MTFDEMVAAVQSAKHNIDVADGQVAETARLIRGKLQSSDVSQYTLRALKDELRRYNPHTGVWRS